MSGLIILGVMGGAIAGAVVMVIYCRLLAVRLGALVAGAAVCVGLGYFGWEPLLGGSHDPGEYFGCAMIFIGLLAFCILRAVDELAKPVKNMRGFPVEVAVPPASAR